MYNPIQITHIPSKARERGRIPFMERFLLETNHNDSESFNYNQELYNEAVFTEGKKSLTKIISIVKEIKDRLDSLINIQDKEVASKKDDKETPNKEKYFDPKKFWRDPLFKKLEDEIQKTFGFRNVEIHPYNEKYNSKTKDFESTMMQCEVGNMLRYPIDGLVTNKGFYDSTHSINMKIYISLGLLKALTDEEVVAVLMHEFGHSIDPAIVDIKYTQVNILSKYLTDRKGAINAGEKAFIKKNKFLEEFIFLGILAGLILIWTFLSFLWDKIRSIFTNTDKAKAEKLQKIREMVRKEPQFNRQNYEEAFADNFARMYGLGVQLISALKKCQDALQSKINSRIKKEENRQKAILEIVAATIKDDHKTHLHRIHSLIREYEDDIKDPNLSPTVKKQMREDVDELKKLLDLYLNSYSELQNRVNRIINEELDKIDAKSNEKPEKKKGKEIPEEKKAALIKEGFEFFDESLQLFEEKHPLKERMEKECPLDRGDLARLKEKFGDSRACSWAKDKKGYFCYTHRARCKSHKEIDDIPQKDVDFVRSTS